MIIFAVLLEAGLVALALHVRDWLVLKGYDESSATVAGFMLLLALNVILCLIAGIDRNRKD